MHTAPIQENELLSYFGESAQHPPTQSRDWIDELLLVESRHDQMCFFDMQAADQPEPLDETGKIDVQYKN